MICVERYKAFEGVLRIKPKNGAGAFELYGQWLYKPDADCWYGCGCSYCAEICEVVEDVGHRSNVRFGF